MNLLRIIIQQQHIIFLREEFVIIFFSSIKTELQAYLLGFYTADGSIDEKRKTLRVELQKGDSEIVYLFKDSISEDARLYQTKEKDFIGPRGKVIHAHGNIGVDITSA